MSGLDIKLWVNKHLGASEFAHSFSRAMLSFEYPPTHYSSHEPIQEVFQEESLGEFHTQWCAQGRSAFGQILFRRREAPRYSGAINFLRGPKASFNSVSFHGLAVGFHKTTQMRSALRSTVDRIFVDLGMSYGRICLKEDFDRKNIQKWVRHADGSIEPRKPIGVDWRVSLPGVYWGNYYGEPYFSWFSSELLKSCPAFSVGMIAERVVRILAYEDPAEAGSTVAEEAEKRIREHLGSSAFFCREDIDGEYVSPFSSDSNWVRLS